MKAQILAPTPENLALAAKTLRSKGVVGVPTETVYGLAGAAFDPDSLVKIFETKQRPKFDPLIVHVGSFDSIQSLEKLKLVDLSKLSKTAQARAESLLKNFWPGPFTLVLPKHPAVPDLVTSGLPTVALRMPKHPVAQKLIQLADTPIAAPSANRFGRISPTNAQAVVDELGEKIDIVLDGGPCEIGLESTIVSMDEQGKCTLLRYGGTPKEKIEQILGEPIAMKNPLENENPNAPGMLKSHYAPSKPLRLLPAPIEQLNFTIFKDIFKSAIPGKTPQESHVGFLMMTGNPDSAEIYISGILGLNATVICLSPKGNLEEAAKNFFSALRSLDQNPKVELIMAEPCFLEEGLGFAMNDRLEKASGI